MTDQRKSSVYLLVAGVLHHSNSITNSRKNVIFPSLQAPEYLTSNEKLDYFLSSNAQEAEAYATHDFGPEKLREILCYF